MRCLVGHVLLPLTLNPVQQAQAAELHGLSMARQGQKTSLQTISCHDPQLSLMSDLGGPWLEILFSFIALLK